MRSPALFNKCNGSNLSLAGIINDLNLREEQGSKKNPFDVEWDFDSFKAHYGRELLCILAYISDSFKMNPSRKLPPLPTSKPWNSRRTIQPARHYGLETEPSVPSVTQGSHRIRETTPYYASLHDASGSDCSPFHACRCMGELTPGKTSC